MAFRLRYEHKKSSFLQALEATLEPMAAAASAAVEEAATIAVSEGKSHIASAGFGTRWQSGLQYRMLTKGPTINAEALIFHSFGPAAVFEHGGEIKGKPLLWLPIEANLPSGTRWTPIRFRQKIGRLASARGPRPILVGVVDGKSVPVFHGVESVNIKKRFNLAAVFEAVLSQLHALYFKHLTLR